LHSGNVDLKAEPLCVLASLLGSAPEYVFWHTE
jgi:hypothetical protein